MIESLPEPMYHKFLYPVMTTDDMTRDENVAHMLASIPKNVGQIQYGKSQELQDEDSTTLPRYEQQSEVAKEEEVTEMEDVLSYGVTSDSPCFHPIMSKSMAPELHSLYKNVALEDDSIFPETSDANSRESEPPTTPS